MSIVWWKLVKTINFKHVLSNKNIFSPQTIFFRFIFVNNLKRIQTKFRVYLYLPTCFTFLFLLIHNTSLFITDASVIWTYEIQEYCWHIIDHKQDNSKKIVKNKKNTNYIK